MSPESKLSPAELRALFPNASSQVIEMSAQAKANLIAQLPTEERPLNRAESRREIKELHLPFMRWLDFHELVYINPRPDRASGIMPGFPDFCIMLNLKVVCVEMKWPGQKLRANQAKVHAALQKAGVPVITATSVEEAIQFVRAELLQREGA